MTREEAIDIIKCLAWHTKPNEEDIEQAIKVLEQEPCDDAISRKAVLDEMKIRRDNGDMITAGFIKGLPPVTPQPEMGRWIVNEWGNISCSECGCTAPYDKVYPGESVFGKAIRVKSNFCPTCGAKMKGSKK